MGNFAFDATGLVSRLDRPVPHGDFPEHLVAVRAPECSADRQPHTAGFDALDRRIAEIHSLDPTLPGEIDAWAEVPHGSVVRAIDAFMKAGITEITFVGTPPPGKER